MKSYILTIALILGLAAAGQAQTAYLPGQQWKSQLHTAAGEAYLSDDEKMVFYYLNLARTRPAYFADSVLKTWKGAPGHDNSYLSTSPYVASLYRHLKTMKPLAPLLPDRALYESASCFAEFSGKTGRTGHDRSGTGCTLRYAECCSYGMNRPIDIVLQLLIDKGIENLAHRKICLGGYTRMGLAIRPHKDYRTNTVLNFK